MGIHVWYPSQTSDSLLNLRRWRAILASIEVPRRLSSPSVALAPYRLFLQPSSVSGSPQRHRPENPVLYIQVLAPDANFLQTLANPFVLLYILHFQLVVVKIQFLQLRTASEDQL